MPAVVGEVVASRYEGPGLKRPGKNYFSLLGFVKPYLSPRHGIWFGDSFLPSLIESLLIPWWLKIDRALPHWLRAAGGRILFSLQK